ncbi:histidinol-phosphate aminotransferase [Scheffersomyces stipitis CBS 6054]|uniref:histidinol-phosphate transaminase n=1 Tax=Scheffersomyces stipitis (strain ATCC 58785 / CBS 6054 / NBRC 10063 / NRRL Y-11545) TaxID=322104 RepID=A3LSV4_PICST|nr:histidinol-phosphate aminotransferase [Scheffersomyces stipitis CBS 6054]ABN65959.1 histidinol-phosphate aminotransferase [Scheffersomyces stipitis CBS 6054]
MPFDIKKTVRPNILTLEPYRCARDDFKTGILLDANENTHGPALTELSKSEQVLELNRYPDPHQAELKQQIINFRNKKPNKFVKDIEANKLKIGNLCLGVGSDESIDMLLRCVCQPGKDKMLICPPTYGMYSICATVNDVEIVKLPLTTPGFQIDIEGIASKVTGDPNIKLVYLTSPGNPTGKLLAVADVIQLLEKVAPVWNGFVIVDEAYIDFTISPDSNYSESMSTLVNEHENLVVLQTLSKSFGLAGIRLGVTFCSEKLSYYLNSMKYPYNISSLTSDVAIRATGEETGLATMSKYVANIIEQRDQLLKNLLALDGVGNNIGGLDSNFLLVEIVDKDGKPSNEVAQALYNTLAVDNQVVVRFRGKELNCTGALRVSVGTEEENKILIEKFVKCLAEVRK